MSSSTSSAAPGEVSDEDLLIQMALNDSQPKEAREAWGHFYERHYTYIAKQAYKMLDAYLGHRYAGPALVDLAQELATEVITRAFVRAETFDLKGGRSPVEIRRQTRAWLGKIAKNIVNDWLTGGMHESGDQSLGELPEETFVDELEHPDFLKCVADAMQQLQDKDRRVLHAFAICFDPSKGTARLSNEESKALAEELGMTPTSLRQVRKRALMRLKATIEANCKAFAPASFPW